MLHNLKVEPVATTFSETLMVSCLTIKNFEAIQIYPTIWACQMELTYHRIKVLQNFGFVSLVRRKKEKKER